MCFENAFLLPCTSFSKRAWLQTLFSLVSTTNGQLSYSCLPGGQMGSAKVQVAKIRRGQCSLPHKHITAICDATASAAMTRLSDDESVVNVFSNAPNRTDTVTRSHGALFRISNP